MYSWINNLFLRKHFIAQIDGKSGLKVRNDLKCVFKSFDTSFTHRHQSSDKQASPDLRTIGHFQIGLRSQISDIHTCLYNQTTIIKCCNTFHRRLNRKVDINYDVYNKLLKGHNPEERRRRTIMIWSRYNQSLDVMWIR